MFAALDPRMWLIGALLLMAVVTGSFVGGCMHGEKLSAGKTVQRDLRAQQADIRRVDNAIDAAQSAAEASAERHVQVITRFQPVEREVIRYVQTSAAAVVCLDDDGLRLWRAANRGELEAATGQPAGHAALPGDSDATGQRPGGRPAGEPPAGDAAATGMRRTPGGAGTAHPGGDPRAGAAQ